MDTSKSNEQVAEETAKAIRDSRDKPETYKQIITIAEKQGIDRDWMLSISDQVTCAKTGDDANSAIAKLDVVMQAVGQEKPTLEAEMRENPITTARCLKVAITEKEAMIEKWKDIDTVPPGYDSANSGNAGSSVPFDWGIDADEKERGE